MRMWNIDPKVMCRQHLLGEHLEMHMFAGCLLKEVSLKGYIKNGLVEVHHIRKRHRFLVREMKRRHYNHRSELPSFIAPVLGKVDKEFNLVELACRCAGCKEKIEERRNLDG